MKPVDIRHMLQVTSTIEQIRKKTDGLIHWKKCNFANTIRKVLFTEALLKKNMQFR